MNGSHHGSDQSLDMSAEMRLSNGPMVKQDTVLLTTPHERLRVELPGVINVDSPRQS